MTEEDFNQLDLDVSVHLEADISDFVGEDWTTVLDAVRQMSMGLIQHCYFHGQLESGKSHLLVAICTLYRDMGKRAVHLPMKTLVNEKTDVLVDIEQYDFIALDDIQCLAGHADWQEAVFHLLNRSVAGECQLAFTANVVATELAFDIQDLVSRIAQCASFALPKDQLIDDRKQILEHILQRRNLIFNDNIIRHLIHHGPTKTGLMIAAVDELQQLSPYIRHKKLKKEIKSKAHDIIEKYAAVDV